MSCLTMIPGFRSDVYPSFVLMAIQNDVVVTFVYELHGNDMKVIKSTFSKEKKDESADAEA